MTAARWCLVLAALVAFGAHAAPPARPLILLTNDDGAGADGLKALRAEMEKLGDVLVVAPEQDSSGASQSLKVTGTIRVKRVEGGDGGGTRVFRVGGPPATCVLLAIERLAGGRKIDLCVSGVNKGENVGLDIPCSGTVGAARMAADLGVPALAVSLAYGSKEFPAAAARAADLVREVLEHGLERGVVLNLNFPRTPPAEWKSPILARPGGRGFTMKHVEKAPKAPAPPPGPDEMDFQVELGLDKGPFPDGSDARGLAEGHMTVTPLGATEDAWPGFAAWRFFR